MPTYTLTCEWDVCRAPDVWQDATLRWLLHRATGCRWPDMQGWELTDDTGQVIAVTRDFYADTESCQEAQAWAANELYTHTGQLPGPWTDTGVLKETIQFTTEGAAEWTGAQLAAMHDRAERTAEALLTIVCTDDIEAARRIAAEAFDPPATPKGAQPR